MYEKCFGRGSITITLVKIENLFQIKNSKTEGQGKDSYSLDNLKLSTESNLL